MKLPSPGWPVSCDRSQPRRFTVRLPRAFFLPWCPSGLCREALTLANAPSWASRVWGLWLRTRPMHLRCLCVGVHLHHPGWAWFLLCALGLPSQNRTGPCDHGSHRTALSLSSQHPGESLWLASKNYFHSLSHQWCGIALAESVDTRKLREGLEDAQRRPWQSWELSKSLQTP